MRILIETLVDQNYKDVFRQFDRQLFLALKPPLVTIDLERFDGCNTGDKVEMKLSILGFKQSWKALIVDQKQTSEQIYFVDEGKELPPPIKSWKHRHILENINDKQTLIKDDIEFSSGLWLLDVLIYPVMYLQFWYRKPIYKKYFAGK